MICPEKWKKNLKFLTNFWGILDLAIFIREGHNLWIFLSVGDSNFFTKARTAHSKNCAWNQILLQYFHVNAAALQRITRSIPSQDLPKSVWAMTKTKNA